MESALNNSLYERALQLAAAAHKDQVRKDSGTPYIVHPIMVARKLQQYGFREEVIAAGLAHDVLEDTKITEATLRQELGDAVVDIVKAVSEDKTLDWETRKIRYVDTVAAAGEEVMAVSVADKIHNAECTLRGFERMGIDIWKVFNRGKIQKLWFEENLLKRLQENWEHDLLKEYAKRLEQLKALPE